MIDNKKSIDTYLEEVPSFAKEKEVHVFYHPYVFSLVFEHVHVHAMMT